MASRNGALHISGTCNVCRKSFYARGFARRSGAVREWVMEPAIFRCVHWSEVHEVLTRLDRRPLGTLLVVGPARARSEAV